MLTIDRLAKIDRIAARIIAALYRGVGWVADHYEDRLLDAAYRVAQAKTKAISKAEEKISALEDSRSALVAEGEEAKAHLLAAYRIALSALEDEIYEREDALLADLAQAARTLVAATEDYDATVKAASDKLDVEIKS